MAHPDRSIGQSGQPDQFAGIVNGLFSPQDRGRLSAEISGFRGTYAGEIAKWQAEGLGRVIAAPLAAEPTGQISRETRFRSMMYALPLTDETKTGFDQQVLLVFPADKGVHLTVVKPKRASIYDEAKGIVDENTLSDFNSLFSPHETPSFVEGWNPDRHASSVSAFSAGLALFPVETGMINTSSPDEILEKAVENARKLKTKRIRTDEYSMRGQLDQDMLTSLEVVVGDWEQIKQEEVTKSERAIFGDGDIDHHK